MSGEGGVGPPPSAKKIFLAQAPANSWAGPKSTFLHTFWPQQVTTYTKFFMFSGAKRWKKFRGVPGVPDPLGPGSTPSVGGGLDPGGGGLIPHKIIAHLIPWGSGDRTPHLKITAARGQKVPKQPKRIPPTHCNPGRHLSPGEALAVLPALPLARVAAVHRPGTGVGALLVAAGVARPGADVAANKG